TFVAWMESRLDSSSGGPAAGHVPMQRLTRTEFGTAVNDLLGIELDATQLLPAEIEVNGFDNIATPPTASPPVLHPYVAPARQPARPPVGAPTWATSPPSSRPRHDQRDHGGGLPRGTGGGIKFRHNFPADGEYRFTIQDLGIDLYSRVLETRHTVVLLVDG